MMKRVMGMLVGAALVLTVAGSVPATARGTDVIRSGACSGTADWKLKLSPDDGGIEVEFEVDSNVSGQTWNVRILQNGTRIFSGSRTTQPPSGSFEVRVLANDNPGTDTFRGRAVNAADGQTCVGTASIG
jgi:hypothetical protein